MAKWCTKMQHQYCDTSAPRGKIWNYYTQNAHYLFTCFLLRNIVSKKL